MADDQIRATDLLVIETTSLPTVLQTLLLSLFTIFVIEQQKNIDCRICSVHWSHNYQVKGSNPPQDLLQIRLPPVDGLPQLVESDLEPEFGFEDFRNAIVAGIILVNLWSRCHKPLS